MPIRTFSTLLLAATLSSACANPNRMATTAPRVPYADLEAGHAEKHVATLRQLPYILEFKAGQEIPLHFEVDSALVELEVPTLRVKAKRDFWVLLRPKGPPLISEDGKNFDQKVQNSFLFGLRVTKGEPPSLLGKVRYRTGD
jgi:hypothetical protein